MLAVNEHGYTKGRVVADWGCPLCRRIIYRAVTEDALNAEERREGCCTDCLKARTEAERRARHLWVMAQALNVRCVNGVYGIRDDLLRHLVGSETSSRLKKLLRDLGQPLPSQLIPPHEPEF